jgi:hypothetical protein
MGLDLWFREDVTRILAATQETMRTSMEATPPLDPETAAAYQQGFADAVRSIAIAFGVWPHNGGPTPGWRQAISAVQHIDTPVLGDSGPQVPPANGNGAKRR